jgi:hypothetical protein
VGIGFGFLAGIVWAVMLGHAAELQLSNKLALLDVVIGAMGFGVAIMVGIFTAFEFEKNMERPRLSVELQTVPVETSSGIRDWRLRWRLRNTGRAACQWIALQVEFSSGSPEDLLDIQDWLHPKFRGGQHA